MTTVKLELDLEDAKVLMAAAMLSFPESAVLAYLELQVAKAEREVALAAVADATGVSADQAANA